ncbi:MAG: peptidoglycan bridge formation glycyltransferase FemA/FemB family protein [Bacilli bacterium]|nr:peptidoglycan bridge formation glycyltransferase FemA/FemB family protein [Bacilli bacterium]
MYIRELNLAEFENFANNHEYNNYHQTLSYAMLKSENEYEYEIIGYCDDENIYAAALVLVKLLDGYLYAYIPEGFLIDYTNEKLLHDFTDALYKYYKKESISFIKINPPIAIAQIDPKTHMKTFNDNTKIVENLKRCGYTKLDDNIYFESILPRINAIVDLDEFDIEKLNKNTKNKIRKGIRKGLTLEIGNSYNLDILYSFIKRKIKKSEFYYNDYYNIFSREHAIDYFLVSIDYERYIINSQDAYNKELTKNENLNKKVSQIPGTRNINKKMNSDKTLLAYKNDISIATKHINNPNKEYVAGALVVKHGDTATILISGYDKTYRDFAPNYYLYYEILRYYRNEFKYVNLNGISGDFSRNNKYHGLNQFKLGFKPEIYEYIGEFDLVINPRIYNKMIKKGLLTKEFNKNK